MSCNCKGDLKNAYIIVITPDFKGKPKVFFCQNKWKMTSVFFFTRLNKGRLFQQRQLWPKKGHHRPIRQERKPNWWRPVSITNNIGDSLVIVQQCTMDWLSHCKSHVVQALFFVTRCFYKISFHTWTQNLWTAYTCACIWKYVWTCVLDISQWNHSLCFISYVSARHLTCTDSDSDYTEERETIPAKATVAKKRAPSSNKTGKKIKLVKASKYY